MRRFCAAQPSSQRRPLLLQRLYPYLPRLQGAVAALPRGVLRRRARRARRSAVLASAALPLDAPAPRLFFSGELRAQLGGYDALDELRERLPADFAPLASAVAGAVSGDRLPAAGLHPVLAGRPRGDGARGRGPLPVPRPPRRRVRGAHPAAAEAARASPRSTSCARACERPAARQRSPTRPKQPYRAPDSQLPSLGARPPPTSSSCCRRPAIDAGGYFDADVRREAGRRSARRPRLDRLPRQHRLRRHPVDPALARDVRSGAEPWHSACSQPASRSASGRRPTTIHRHERVASWRRHRAIDPRASSRRTSCSARTAGRSATTNSLLDAGLINSTGILELVAFLESEFGIDVQRRRDRAGKPRFGRPDRRLRRAQASRCRHRGS